MLRAKHLLGVTLVGAWLSAPSSAFAFCRTTTVNSPPEQTEACAREGAPLFHSAQCFPYRLLTKDSAVIPNAALSDTFARAFNTWTSTNPKCTPGISAIELAPTSDAEIVGYRTGQRGGNVIGVAPTWPYTGANDTLSLATLTFDATTGEVFDSDLEVNGTVPWSFTSAAPPPGVNDLESVLAHEIGHILGIAHSTEPEATMFASYQPGEITQRTLEPDDHDAICTIYPNRAQRLTAAGLVPSTRCNLAPGDPNTSCGDPSIIHGCATSRSSPLGKGGGMAALFLFSSIGLGVARKRAARGNAPMR